MWYEIFLLAIGATLGASGMAFFQGSDDPEDDWKDTRDVPLSQFMDNLNRVRREGRQ